MPTIAADADLDSHRALGIAATFGLMHAVVDASSVGLLMWGTLVAPAAIVGETLSYLPEGAVWSRFLLYNALAFGTQFPIGAVADRWKAYRSALLTGLAMLLIAAAIAPFSPPPAIVLAALGNAAFHVGAGALVLTHSSHRAAPIGIFVGPGAVGLAVGMWAGRSLDVGPWIFLGPLAGCAALAVILRTSQPQQDDRQNIPSVPWSTAAVVICMAAMVLAVALRTANGNSVSLIHETSAGVVWALAIAACAGNILGGFVADRLGWLSTCVLALLLSAPLVSFFVGLPAAAITGVVLFQMTMPVTLMAVWRAFTGEPGFAFGLAALGVLVGVVPTYLCPSEWLTSGGVLLVLTFVSLVAIWIGLTPVLRAHKAALSAGQAL